MIHGWDGQVRVGEIYKHPPAFEESYGSWYLGRVVPKPGHAEDRLFAYRIWFPLETRDGRGALRRFLSNADEAGYDVRHHQAERDRGVSPDGTESTPFTFVMALRPGYADPPERTTPVERARETLPPGGHEQTVFDREAELERQLEAAQAKLARQRKQQNDSQSRWRERQGDEGRRKHAEYMRNYRAQKRQ
jgi:hypothetical protein